MGDFSHTLLILFATQQLAPSIGMTRAASLAIGFYTLHNVFYAGSAYVAGWLGDRVRRRTFVLAGGYGLAGATAILLSAGAGRLGEDQFSLLAGVRAAAFSLGVACVGDL